jgi:hypothetical protein
MTVSGDTTRPEREYRRAMRDFTQLSRRRLSNHLTAITGGLTALRDLDEHLDRRVRGQLLESLLDAAADLERVVLHPELARDGDGDGAVIDLDDAQLAEVLVADIVHAEQHARTINERLFTQLAATPEQPVDFLCECWALECEETVTLPMADYWIVHARHDQFVIAPGHDMPTVEQVVEQRDSWWVVRKSAASMQSALDHRLRALHTDQ